VAQAGEPTFTKHVVAAQEAHAADVGRNVLRAGGKAIDAAVATALRPGGDSARGGESGRRRIHRGLPGRSPRGRHGRFPGARVAVGVAPHVPLEGPSWTQTVRAELAAMGHHVWSIDRLGIANTIIVDPSTGQIHGIADRRRSTTKSSGD